MVDIVSMILALNGATRSDQIPPRQRAQDLPDTLLLVVLPCRIVLLELMSPLKAALIKCVMAERGLELEVQFGLGGTGALASVVEGPGEPNDAPPFGRSEALRVLQLRDFLPSSGCCQDPMPELSQKLFLAEVESFYLHSLHQITLLQYILKNQGLLGHLLCCALHLAAVPPRMPLL